MKPHFDFNFSGTTRYDGDGDQMGDVLVNINHNKIYIAVEIWVKRKIIGLKK